MGKDRLKKQPPNDGKRAPHPPKRRDIDRHGEMERAPDDLTPDSSDQSSSEKG